MVVEKILKQLTPGRVRKEIEAIREVKFPLNLQKWMDEYGKIGERDDFVFRWCYKINTDWVLVDIPKKYRDSLEEVKTLFNMFIVLIDDISEKKTKAKLLNELLKIPFYEKYIELKKLNLKEGRYLKFTVKVWHQISKTIKKYPHYKGIRDFFEFDVFQFLNAVKYGYLICKNPYAADEIEYWVYFPQSMQIIIDSDLDLMCASKFDLKEMGQFREVVLMGQKMARIGNWLTTWEREVKHRDFTSVVIPYAISHNIIDVKELQTKNREKLLEKIRASKPEDYFLKKWEEYYKEIRKSKKIKSADYKRILKKLEYLIFMHLISRGCK